MENYKIIILKLARPDMNNGIKMFSRLMGIPEDKSSNLIQMMPFVVFEVKNYAIARKIKGLLAPMESFGFPILISMESGPISKVNWPKGIKLNGIPVEQIIESVPDFVNLMNHCPSCGLELRYQISLRIENESIKFPLGGNINVEGTKVAKLEDESEIIDAVELDEIEELTDLDETNGSVPLVNEEFIAHSVDTEDFDEEIVEKLLEVGESVDVVSQSARGNEAINYIEQFDMDEASYGLAVAYEEEPVSKEVYGLEIGVISSLNDKIKASKILSGILGIPESESLQRVKRTGDLIISGVSLEEAQKYKKEFELSKIKVKIVN